MSKVLVIGGGAAGMFASIFAAKCGNEVHVFDKNEKLGKKLYITGKGRCNITNASEMEDLFANVVSNHKFLYSAFYSCTNQDVIEFFESNGVPIKIERGNRVFPVSDKSSDVIAALSKAMKKQGVMIHLNQEVTGLKVNGDKVEGVLLKNGEWIKGDAVIVATGGLSYPTTGSTGDGYRFAKDTGHCITRLFPSLVPFTVKESFVKELQGLSLKNVQGTIYKGKKQLYTEFGEMLFTHFGVSGPIMLSASSRVADTIKEENLQLHLDLKPALTQEQLDQRLLREFEEHKNRQFKNSLGSLYPAKLIPIIIEVSGIDPEKKVNEITKEERSRLIEATKKFPLTLTGLCDYNQAIITKGGVSVKDINPSTMESKHIKGLYFVGEVLDLDALTGGFNLQIAWSTSYVAGNSITK